MMRAEWILLLGVLSIGATGCSQGDPKHSKSNTFYTGSLVQSQTLASKAQLHCTDETQCNPSVGMLLESTTNAVYQCTSFLISNDIVATNSHCIPDDLKAGGSACQDRIKVIFPEMSGYPEDRVGCGEVISASEVDDSHSTPDYAFIRLAQPVKRPALSIKHEALADSTILSTSKIDPYQGNGIPEGYMHSAQCRIVLNSILVPGSGSQSGVVTIGDCEVVHGNSGSPLLDSSGNVRGIVFATVDTKRLSTRISDPSSGLRLLDPNLSPLGLATNYSCLSTPLDVTPPSCVNAGMSVQATQTGSSADLTNLLKAKLSVLDPSIRWTVTSVHGQSATSYDIMCDASSTLAFAVPQCLENKNDFLASETKNGEQYPQSSDRNFLMPIWTIQSGLNRYMQDDTKITEASPAIERVMVLHYDPQNLTNSGSSKISITNTDSIVSGDPLYSGQLSPCTN